MIDPGKIFNFEGLCRDGNKLSAEWTVPPGCPYLDGHFPGLPVIPAVGLLDGSLELLRLCGTDTPPGRLTLKKAKFTGMVAPGMRVRVSLVHKEKGTDVEWRKLDTNEPLATFNF